MNYPLISEYIEAIKSAEYNYEELSYLIPVLGDDGQPVLTSGNFAVVFKMKDKTTGKFYALKCFTKEQTGRAEAYHQIADALKDVDSPYLVSLRYLDKELFVDTKQTDETEFPVLLMDWVEGKTLDKYLRENLDDKYALEMLAYRFSQLAQWLIPQPFAHGDLKPDNILVREDGTLVLVDYDGMYVPAMKGQKARELGSPDFRHPLRTENDFNEHIDDFPLVSILLSLKATSVNPQWLEEFGALERLLFCFNDYINIGTSAILKDIFPSKDRELNMLVGTMISILYVPQLEIINKTIDLKIPFNILSTEALPYEIEKGILDKDGILYSRDGRKLLRSYDYCGGSPYIYLVREGTQIICDNAFAESKTGVRPVTLILPSSLVSIGKDAFESIFSPCVSELLVPNGTYDRFIKMTPQYSHFIFEIALATTYSDTDIKDGITDESKVLYSKDKIRLLQCDHHYPLYNYNVQYGTKVICNKAFEAEVLEYDYFFHPLTYGSALSNIKLPNTLIRIGSDAFKNCINLRHISIPDSCLHIGAGAFWGSSIEEITIPSSVQMVEDFAFGLCADLKKISFKGTPRLGRDLFFETWSLKEIIIPKGSKDYFEEKLLEYKDIIVEQKNIEYLNCEVTKEDLATGWMDEYGVKYSADRTRLLDGYYVTIKNYVIKKETKVICNGAFVGSMILENVVIPEGVLSLGANAFAQCYKLKKIVIPSSVSHISGNPFSGLQCKIICRSNSYVVAINENSSKDMFYSLYTKDMKKMVHCGYSDVIWYDPNLSFGYDSDPYTEKDKVFNIPDSVEVISMGAFLNSELYQTLVIHSSIKIIEKYAFLECPLKSIILPDKVDIDSEAFIPQDLRYNRLVEKIIVPKGSLDYYRAKLPYDLDRIYELGSVFPFS